MEDHVEGAAGEPPGPREGHDVPVHPFLEGEDVVAVDRHPLAVEVQDHDLAGVVGQEQVPGARGHHKVDALAGEGLLEEAPEAPALVVEAHLALVGDHRAELSLYRVAVQPDLQERGVLQRERLARGHLPKLVEVRFAHRTASRSLVHMGMLPAGRYLFFWRRCLYLRQTNGAARITRSEE